MPQSCVRINHLHYQRIYGCSSSQFVNKTWQFFSRTWKRKIFLFFVFLHTLILQVKHALRFLSQDKQDIQPKEQFSEEKKTLCKEN